MEPRLKPTAELKSLNAYRRFIEALQDKKCIPKQLKVAGLQVGDFRTGIGPYG